ncbi:50S ribosomal protein L24e [Candidatus Woesearchaeota archaeon]|nr:50S ribosomal protein L24e [Candidatus Woesearchaeota archaeon]
MAKCSFCKRDIEPGTGKIFITKEGKDFHFCSMKCEKNQLKLKRLPRNLNWIRKRKK